MTPPDGLGAAGEGLWARIVVESGLDFAAFELVILEEAARTADVLAGLREADEPNLVEIRMQSEMLRKLLRSVDWPRGDEASQAGRRLAGVRWHGESDGVASA